MTNNNLEFLLTLENTIQGRLRGTTEDSYTAHLAAAGTKRIAQKVGEEAIELALAAVAGDKQEMLDEAADLTYHLLVLLNAQDIHLADVIAVLESRHKN